MRSVKNLGIWVPQFKFFVALYYFQNQNQKRLENINFSLSTTFWNISEVAKTPEDQTCLKIAKAQQKVLIVKSKKKVKKGKNF